MAFEVSLLGPIRNPALMRAYKISARGGLLLYRPPGCGTTFPAKAVSGEIGANFYPVGISDVLSRWLGESERAVHEIFETARRNAPATADNAGMYLLGATNARWEVDAALRRPGRFDRMLFVGPPDAPARAEIARVHLRDRPAAGVNLALVAARTEGFSGADIAHICATATQLAMADAVRSGQVRPVGMADIDTALVKCIPVPVHGSTWLATWSSSLTVTAFRRVGEVHAGEEVSMSYQSPDGVDEAIRLARVLPETRNYQRAVAVRESPGRDQDEHRTWNGED